MTPDTPDTLFGKLQHLVDAWRPAQPPGFAVLPEPEQRAPILETRAPKALPGAAGGLASGSGRGVLEPRRGSRTLRAFSEMNPWVRTAINHRKRAITQAKFTIVRTDDAKAAPVPKVVDSATELFNYVNNTAVNLSWLLGMLVEDLLVFDAGVWEIEHTVGGDIAALWPVPGEEIAPSATWDGSKPDEPRYRQFRDGKLIAAYKNDEMTYMMANPRSNSPVGFSPLEALFDTVEAELYSAKMEYRLMRETAPAGILYMGSGVPPESVAAFRDQWENDIAAQRSIAFFGGGETMVGEHATGPQFVPFKGNANDDDRRAYIKWLVTKISACFEISLLAFNLSETITKSVGNSLTAQVDTGLLALGHTIEQFITREIMWVIDPTHRHGFQFLDLIPRDTTAKLKNQQILMSLGARTPNEIRAQMGEDPYPGSVGNPAHWSHRPYPFQGRKV